MFGTIDFENVPFENRNYPISSRAINENPDFDGHFEYSRHNRKLNSKGYYTSVDLCQSQKNAV